MGWAWPTMSHVKLWRCNGSLHHDRFDYGNGATDILKYIEAPSKLYHVQENQFEEVAGLLKEGTLIYISAGQLLERYKMMLF